MSWLLLAADVLIILVVQVEFFTLVEDEATAPFFDALERACKRGVQVRVLSDHVAQFMYPYRKQTIRRFADMGAEYQPMLPLQPLRGHWRRPDLATTGSWLSWTARSDSPAPRT